MVNVTRLSIVLYLRDGRAQLAAVTIADDLPRAPVQDRTVGVLRTRWPGVA
jgi:hypothetical protein